MIHRFALRVLPSLTLAVTEEQFRKRKRWLMLWPGLVAFALYRLLKLVTPFHDVFSLLLLSGCIAAATALWAYTRGRQASLSVIWREDGPRRVAWLVGWVGFAYGVQLSLLVLALLRVLANYDFLIHPDGPAMMALIIPSTSVARDAFEIGHLRYLEVGGKPLFTFPDGRPFWTLVFGQKRVVAQWFLLASFLSLLVGWSSMAVGFGFHSELGQFFLVSLLGGTLGLMAYFSGLRPGNWLRQLSGTPWSELFRFWWWPGLAFAATYFLVLLGLALYVFGQDPIPPTTMLGMAVTVGVMMTLYCWYLGNRRAFEDQVRQEIPSTLLRCPFVMGILSKEKPLVVPDSQTSGDPTPEAMLGSSGSRN